MQEVLSLIRLISLHVHLIRLSFEIAALMALAVAVVVPFPTVGFEFDAVRRVHLSLMFQTLLHAACFTEWTRSIGRLSLQILVMSA